MRIASSIRPTFVLAVALSCALFAWPVPAEQDPQLLLDMMARRQIATERVEIDAASAGLTAAGYQEGALLDVTAEAIVAKAREAGAELQNSSDPADRRILTAILGDASRPGALSTLERRARTRDRQAAASPEASRARAEEWKRIGALAFLDSTARAIQAYEQALRLAPEDVEALDMLAWLYGRQARMDERTATAERLTRLSDPKGRALGFIHLADIRLDANDGAGARPHIDQALTVVRGADLPRQEAMALALLAATQVSERDYDEAAESVARSLALSRANGFRDEEAAALYIQGTAHYVQGVSSFFGRKRRFERAEAVNEELETLLRGRNDEIAVAQLQIRRGQIARMMEDYALSERRLRGALETLDRLGVRARYGFAQQQLAATLAKQGRYEEAIPLFQASVDDARRTRQPQYEGNALLEWAQAEAARSDNAAACRLARESAAAFRRAPGHEGMARGVGAYTLIWGCSRYP